MADLEARREARRRKILQNSENRMNRLLGQPAESSDARDSNPDNTEGLTSSSTPSPEKQEHVDNGQSTTEEGYSPAIQTESQTSAATVRHREVRTNQPESQPSSTVQDAVRHAAKKPAESDKTKNGVGDGLGKEEPVSTDPLKVLDLMRCGGCLLVAFLTRWALSFGLGILFLEWVTVPFILLEVFLFYFQTTHMKDVKLPHKNHMMTTALMLCGIKPEIISKYSTIMGYVSAVMDDFAVYFFTFLLFHAVMA